MMSRDGAYFPRKFEDARDFASRDVTIWKTDHTKCGRQSARREYVKLVHTCVECK